MSSNRILYEEVIPLSILSVFIVAANAMVCGLVCKFKSMRTFTNGFAVSLAVSDILVGGLLFPLKLANVQPSILQYLISAILISGVGNLCAVTLDRYIAVTRPLEYSYLSSKWFGKTLVVCWLGPLTISLLPLVWNGSENARIYSIYTVCLVVLGIILPYCGIFIAYFKIFTKIKRHNRHLSSVVSSGKFQRRTVSMEAKVSKVSAIVAIAFVFSWLPVIYMTLVYEISPILIPESLYTVSVFTIAVGSLANPIFYAFMKPDFKAALVRLGRKRKQLGREPGTITLQVSLRETQKLPENISFHSSCRRIQSNPVITRNISLRRSLRRGNSLKFYSQGYNEEHSPTFHSNYFVSEYYENQEKSERKSNLTTNALSVASIESSLHISEKSQEKSSRRENAVTNLGKLGFGKYQEKVCNLEAPQPATKLSSQESKV